MISPHRREILKLLAEVSELAPDVRFGQLVANLSYLAVAELNRNVEIPLAGGENNRLTHEFLQICEKGVYDILQPEGMVMEGVTALRKIGALAEFYGKRIYPHHGGGDIGTVAHLHLVASWPHAPYEELLHDPPIADYRHRFSIMKNPPLVGSDGFIPMPQGPGLGVEIDPALRA